MPNTKIIRVSHLWGIDVAYQMPHPYDKSKPTVVLINSFTTSSELYSTQFKDRSITDKVNLLAIEPLGHGQTKALNVESFTYWDTAIMNLQVLDALGIFKAFALGTSQGGFIVVRMALLAPERIEGIIPLGTSMDFESPRTHELGCWDGRAVGDSLLEAWDLPSSPPEAFVVSEDYCNLNVDLGLGRDCDKVTRDFWVKEIQANYHGDAGRRMLRMCAMNLKDRDGLHTRLRDVKCPVLWMQGTDDKVFSVKNAQEEIKMFRDSKKTELVIVEGGNHFLSATNPEQVGKAMVGFVGTWHGKGARL